MTTREATTVVTNKHDPNIAPIDIQIPSSASPPPAAKAERTSFAPLPNARKVTPYGFVKENMKRKYEGEMKKRNKQKIQQGLEKL